MNARKHISWGKDEKRRRVKGAQFLVERNGEIVKRRVENEGRAQDVKGDYLFRKERKYARDERSPGRRKTSPRCEGYQRLGRTGA